MIITNNEENTSQTALGWALRYAELGWPVHPLHSVYKGVCSCRKGAQCGKDAGKHPRLSNFKEHATTEPTHIRNWWARWPEANIGMITGAQAGIIMLDIDNEAAERWLREQGYPYHDGPVIFTGKGRRLIFQHPGIYIKTRNRIIKGEPEIGLDILGDKGNAVMPPSTHYLGMRYGWDMSSEIGQMPATPPPPEWLMRLIAPNGSEANQAPGLIGWDELIPAPTPSEEANQEANRPPPLIGNPPAQEAVTHSVAGHCHKCGGPKEYQQYPRCWSCEKEKRISKWGERAIETELANLRMTQHGRNEKLAAISWRMGKLVSHGFLSFSEAVQRLTDANPAQHDEPAKSLRTIESQLRKGEDAASPSDLPHYPREAPQPKGKRATPSAPTPSAPTPAPTSVHYVDGYWVPRESAEPPITPPVDLMSFELNDAGNAEAVAALHADRFRHVEQWGWMHYDGKCWTREGGSKQLFKAVKATLRGRIQRALNAGCDEDKLKKYFKVCSPETKVINATITQLKNMPALDARPSDFDQYPMLINMANGILDLTTGQLMPHDSQYMLTHYCNVPYNPQANQSIITNFLTSLGLSEAVIDYLQQAVGYSLTGSTREECLFYLHGPTRSGKGTFVSMIRALMTSPLSAEIKFDILTGSKRDDPDAQNFALAPLKGCRVIAASESGRYQTINEAKVKSLTGGDAVYCAFKNKTHFNYTPQFKIWLTSNHPPRADVDDDAIWMSRIKVISFPMSFLGRENKQLKEYLTTPEAQQSFLAWSVQGCLKWQQNPQGLESPAEIKEATNRAREEMDEVGQWLEENTEISPHIFTPNEQLYSNYNEWCQENGFTAKKARSLGRSLSKKGFANDRRYIPKLGKKQRGWLGIRLL